LPPKHAPDMRFEVGGRCTGGIYAKLWDNVERNVMENEWIARDRSERAENEVC
jgi:hypothetical protein